MCESMPGVFLGIVLKNGKGTMTRETVLSRTAFVAAAGTALLTLVGCGGQRTQDATGFNDDRPVKDKMDAGATSGDSGDADSGSADAFDTWSDDCWDAHRNISIAALLELKGWQLQEFASQQGYAWQDALEMYEDEAGHVLSVCNISKDGATEWLGEDEIGKLDKGGTGSTVMFTLQLSAIRAARMLSRAFPCRSRTGRRLLRAHGSRAYTVPTWRGTLPWRVRWKTVTTAWISLPRRLSRPVGLPRAAVLRR